MTYTPKHLRRWTMPQDYFGEVWPDYYSSGFGQSRDSDALERSNFTCALKALGGEDGENLVVVREGHWAVGWVEWIAIHCENDKALETADQLRADYLDYPVVDEMHYSDLEYSEAADFWARSDVSDRVHFIKQSRCGVSIFAARRDHMPEDDPGNLYDLLRSA